MPRDPSSTGPNSAPDSVCVLRLSAIGDCCHVLPVVRTLQAAYPNMPVTWITGKTEHSLLRGADGIEFITFDKSLGLRGLADLKQKLRGRSFPVLLNMHASMRANLASCTITAQRRIGFDRERARDYQWLFCTEQIPAQARQHVMDGLFGFAEHLGAKSRELRWDIPVSAKDKQWAAAVTTHTGPVIVISPCSSQRARNFRNWSVENYQGFVRHVQHEYGAKVLLTGGPTDLEQEYGRQIAKAGDSIVNLVGQTSLKQLLALLADADLLLCPDSGPAHMAAAAGTPVVGLYATSNRYRTGPYFSQHLVADRYPEAVQKEFGKHPDELRWGQRVRNPAAMEFVSLAEVTAKVDIVLQPGYAHPQQRRPLPDLCDTG